MLDQLPSFGLGNSSWYYKSSIAGSANTYSNTKASIAINNYLKRLRSKKGPPLLVTLEEEAYALS